MRVTVARERLGLALEPLLQVRVSGDMLGQDLDGNGAIQTGVAGLIDLSHAACAERAAISYGPRRVPALRGTALSGLQRLAPVDDHRNRRRWSIRDDGVEEEAAVGSNRVLRPPRKDTGPASRSAS